MQGLENLEIKAYRRSSSGSDFLNLYFEKILSQTDTYYKTTDGRLKLREEVGESAYAIRYDRTNDATERTCVYDFYDVPEPNHFRKVFGGALTEEIVVKKERSLSLYKNARIHVDEVEGLDTLFIEIEVVVRTDQQRQDAPKLMEELLQILDIKPEDKISLGYRELLLADRQIK